MKIYLIRHAVTKESTEGISQTDEAEIVKKTVDREKFKEIKPDKVYSSPYKRATQTAEILFEDYEVLDFIYEFKAPSFLKGEPREKSRAFWDEYLPEARRDADWKYEDGESFNETVSRVNKLINFLKNKDFDSVAIVGHATFFRHLLGVLKFGKDYSFERYEKDMANISWDNLEVKEVHI